MHSVVLPVLDANMTHGVVRTWHKREGETIQAGEPLFEVETDKVNVDVEAEVSGVLRRIVAPVGSRIPILGLVAFVGGADEAVPPPEAWNAPAPPAPAADSATPQESPETVTAAATAPSRIAASPAARRLARARGLPLEGIHPTGPRGEITRADVEAFAGSTAVAGRVDPAFLDQLRRDASVFRMLSSEMKVRLYREHGAQIGDGVRIEPGAVILAREISIGTAARIGAESTIDCERLSLGRLAAFGKRTRVHCRRVEIGDALWSKDDVVIGGGGADEPGACLRAGDACFFGEGAYLNTGHPLTLGNEVCIGSRAMLFTHSHWQSILRGYPSLFGPITVGNHVFIGNNAFVFPGVTIAAGVTVMVNSFVAHNVPPDTLVGGVPAQVIRRITAPTRTEQIAILRARMPELAARLGAHGYRVASREHDDAIILDLDGNRAVHLVPSWPPSSPLAAAQRAVVLTFGNGTEPNPHTGMTLFDLASARVFGVQDQLSDEVREFCRRRGIRFQPFAWRYGVGHFDGLQFHFR